MHVAPVLRESGQKLLEFPLDFAPCAVLPNPIPQRPAKSFQVDRVFVFFGVKLFVLLYAIQHVTSTQTNNGVNV